VSVIEMWVRIHHRIEGMCPSLTYGYIIYSALRNSELYWTALWAQTEKLCQGCSRFFLNITETKQAAYLCLITYNW